MAKPAPALHSRLAQYRLAAGITQQQLAESAEVSRQTIVAIERGDYAPSSLLALRLSLLLGVPVERLFSLPESEVVALAERREQLLKLAPRSQERGAE